MGNIMIDEKVLQRIEIAKFLREEINLQAEERYRRGLQIIYDMCTRQIEEMLSKETGYVSAVDKLKPLQELENLKTRVYELEALILSYNLKLHGLARQDFEKHFNITTERYGGE
jgi:hypothetical protein